MSQPNEDVNAKKSNKNPTESVDKENEADICSLQDVIDSEKELDSQASAVLGASDANNCSYDKGYVYRQALYCCATCLKAKKQSIKSDTNINDDEILHGICLACSYACHENHELYELYTKRYFRCDCGNSKFNINGKIQPCKLKSVEKNEINSQNKYNHNFQGLYCTCNRPYPEHTSELDASNELNNSTNANDNATAVNDDSGDMLQCTICEDWYHSNHLEGRTNFPINDEDYEEMICHTCMGKNEFLWQYQGYIGMKSDGKSKDTSDTNIVDVIGDVSEKTHAENAKNENEIGCALDMLKVKNKDLKLEKLDQVCFFIKGWREALCKCEKCLNLYKQNDVEFLTKSNDTIQYYEDCGKLKEAEHQQIDENKLIDEQLSKLNRTSRLDFLHSVNDFKQGLKDFLGEFAQQGKVVKRENIEAFFESLNERKKRKLEDETFNKNAFY